MLHTTHLLRKQKRIKNNSLKKDLLEIIFRRK